MGGDATINADLARRVLAGEHGPHRDIVSLNAGAGLLVAGLADDLPAGIEAAREAIDSGRRRGRPRRPRRGLPARGRRRAG